MTPELSKALQDLRSAGYAIAIFGPDEIRGADASVVENRLVELGNDVIKDLAQLIDPEAEGGVELELNFNADKVLTGCVDPHTKSPIDVKDINQAALKGAYVYHARMTFPKNFITSGKFKPLNTFETVAGVKNIIQGLGMGYGTDLLFEVVDSNPLTGDLIHHQPLADKNFSPEISVCLSAVVHAEVLPQVVREVLRG